VDLPSKSSGYVSKITANELGTAAMMLGAGRQTKESEIDLAVGLVLNKKVGDFVEKGETLLTIHSNSEDLAAIKENIYQSIKVDENKVEPPKLIYELIDGLFNLTLIHLY